MASAAKKHRMNSVGNFWVDLIDGAVMRAFCLSPDGAKYEVDPKEADSDEALAMNLTQAFREKEESDSIVKCDKCEGEAPEHLSSCPFCGLKGAITEEAPTSGDNDTTAITDPETLAASVKDEGKAAKKTSAKKDKAPKAEKAAKKSAALAVVKGEPAAAAVVEIVLTEKDLDGAVGRVKKYAVDAKSSYWALGNEIRQIHDQKLWKLRLDEKGKVRWLSFDSFCHGELGITPTTAHDMRRLAETYTDETQLAGASISKFVLVAKAPEAARPALEQKARGGASYREIREEVQKAREESPEENPKQQSKAGTKGGKAKAEKTKKVTVSKKDMITIADIQGKRTIKLFAKPETLRNLDMSTLKRAKTLAAVPFGIEEMPNGVTRYYSVQSTENGLVLVCETRRDEE